MNERANEESVSRGDAWEQCTAQGSNAQTLRHFKTLSFIEKVEWLEEAEEIALRFRAGCALVSAKQCP